MAPVAVLHPAGDGLCFRFDDGRAGRLGMLVELGLVEQRYQAVLEVLNASASVSEVAARFGVTRQSVHRWLRRYAAQGLAGLVDGSTVPNSCPHQMSALVEAGRMVPSNMWRLAKLDQVLDPYRLTGEVEGFHDQYLDTRRRLAAG